MGVSGPSLLIESTDSMIVILGRGGLGNPGECQLDPDLSLHVIKVLDQFDTLELTLIPVPSVCFRVRFSFGGRKSTHQSDDRSYNSTDKSLDRVVIVIILLDLKIC